MRHQSSVELHPSHCKNLSQEAVDAANVDILKLLLERGANPNQINRRFIGTTVLYHATKAKVSNRLSILKLLVSHGADMNNGGILSKMSPFSVSLCENRVDEVKLFLEHGFKIDQCEPQESKEYSPLHVAVLHRDTDMLSLLLEYFAKFPSSSCLDATDSDENSPLRLAVIKGRVEHLRLLLEAGAVVEYVDSYFNTPLTYAIFGCTEFYPECIRLIIDAGANMRNLFNVLGDHILIDMVDGWKDKLQDLSDWDNEYPDMDDDEKDWRIKSVQAELESECVDLPRIKCAVRYRLLFESRGLVKEPLDVVKFDELVDYFASCENIFKITYTMESKKEKPLLGDDVATKQWPIRTGATSNAMSSVNSETLFQMIRSPNEYPSRLLSTMLKASGAPIDRFVDAEGNTLLLHATKHANLDAVKELLDIGADPNFISKKRYGKNIPAQTRCCRSALHDAIDAENVDILKLLLERGANPNQTNSYGTSVLYHVTKSNVNRLPMLKLLLSYGADMYSSSLVESKSASDGADKISQNREDIVSPFVTLLQCYRVSDVRLFLEHGFDIDRCPPLNPNKSSPLHLAVLHEEDTDMLSLLLEHYIKNSKCIDVTDYEENTPLRLAVIKGHVEHVRLLLEAGANVDYLDVEGDTPMEFAIFESSKLYPECIRDDNRWTMFMSMLERMYMDLDRAKCVVRYRLLFESKCPVEEPLILDMIKSDKLREYFESCKAELPLLQNTPLHFSVTYYNLLMDNNFHVQVRDESAYEKFEKVNVEELFPVHAKDLRICFDRVKERHRVWELAMVKLSRLLGLDRDAYHLIFCTILRYLRENDLRNLSKI
ncbi:hypothetical protein QAD02_023952 [Eretmocerus hayati]|uniref:Uncharacterized protein n=1 Tax=Eretmocerus hayati TaxID=131215 RepID=A0ACC2PXN6_9HYME|nr:hypothetical protein QAD02_023952 [Eretmocerus hayati]